MLLTIAISLLVISGVLTIVATPLAPGALTASCIAWTMQSWNDDRVLAVQYALLGILCLVATILEVRHRSFETPRQT